MVGILQNEGEDRNRDITLIACTEMETSNNLSIAGTLQCLKLKLGIMTESLRVTTI